MVYWRRKARGFYFSRLSWFKPFMREARVKIAGKRARRAHARSCKYFDYVIVC